MAITLLDQTNRLLHRTGIITSDLSALTGNSLQADVDAAVEAVNDVLNEIASLSRVPVLGEGSFTLAVNDRSYAVASDFVQVWDPLFRDETNGDMLVPYPTISVLDPTGFFALRSSQNIPAQNKGLPTYWTINPTTSEFYLNTLPQAADVVLTRTYKYIYEKSIDLTTANEATNLPFADEIIRRLIPAMEEKWRKIRKGKMDKDEYQKSLALAAKIMPQVPRKARYGPGH